MSTKVTQMIDLLFRDLEPSEEVQALHDEVLNNCQERFDDLIRNHLSEEEAAVFKRGRNANVHNIPKNADRSEYQRATALESLFGWLYLQGKRERISELFGMMMEANDAT